MPRRRKSFSKPFRSGQAQARGAQGSAAKWAHSALALASRTLIAEGATGSGAARPEDVLAIASKVVADGGERGGDEVGEIGPEQGRALLCAWLASVELAGEGCPEGIVEMMKADDFSHSDLYRRARRIHERKLRAAVDAVTRLPTTATATARPCAASSRPACRRSLRALGGDPRLRAREADRPRRRAQAGCPGR